MATQINVVGGGFFNFHLEITAMQELMTLVSLKTMESVDFSLVTHFLISTLENYLELLYFMEAEKTI